MSDTIAGRGEADSPPCPKDRSTAPPNAPSTRETTVAVRRGHPKNEVIDAATLVDAKPREKRVQGRLMKRRRRQGTRRSSPSVPSWPEPGRGCRRGEGITKTSKRGKGSSRPSAAGPERPGARVYGTTVSGALKARHRPDTPECSGAAGQIRRPGPKDRRPMTPAGQRPVEVESAVRVGTCPLLTRKQPTRREARSEQRPPARSLQAFATLGRRNAPDQHAASSIPRTIDPQFGQPSSSCTPPRVDSRTRAAGAGRLARVEATRRRGCGTGGQVARASFRKHDGFIAGKHRWIPFTSS